MKDSGYILLEVVVGFAIASLALTVLYDATGTALDRERRAVERLDQIAVAENLMESIGSDYLLENTSRADVTDAGINWSLEIDQQNVAEEGERALFTIKAAAWADDETRAVRFTTWRIGLKDR